MSDKREEAMLEYADSDFNESEWQKYRVYVEKKYPTLVQSWVVARGMFNAGWNARAGYDVGRSEREWRRVEDGLPTEEGEYIVQKRDGEICIRWINPNMGDAENYFRRYFVAWMPLPEPYQEAK